MRRVVLTIGLLLWATSAAATWTQTDVQSAAGVLNLPNAPISVVLNAGTGTNVIACWVSYYAGTIDATFLTDTASNTYSFGTIRTSGGDANNQGVWFYKIAPSTSATDTITYTSQGGNGANGQLICYSFTQGSSPSTDGTQGSGTNSGGTITVPSLGAANDLVVQGCAFYTNNTSISIDGSFSTVTQVNYDANHGIGAVAAWKQVGGAVSSNWTMNSGNVAGCQGIAFTGSGAGGGVKPCTLTTLGVGSC